MANLYQLPGDAIAGSIYLAKNLDTSKDIVVSFDYACYGTDLSGSEGFCVFLINSYANALNGGGPGPGLCYATTNGITATTQNGLQTFFDGVYYGELGVGFDITGNFGTSGFGSGGGYAKPVRNSIAIRDSFNTSFNLLYRSESLNNPAFSYPFELYQQMHEDITYRRVRIRFTDFCQRVVVDFNQPDADECFTNYIDAPAPGDRPPSVNCCLSFASGLNKTSFRIKNFNINGMFTTLSSIDSTDIFTYIAEPYLGLSPSPAQFTVYDTISAVNAPPYNTGPILSACLIDVTTTGNAPFITTDNYILITPL